MKDSANYVDHLNGKKHQRMLGMSLRTKRSSLKEVQRRMVSNKRKQEGEESNYDFESRVKEARMVEEEMKKKRREEKRKRKKAKQSSSSESSEEEVRQEKKKVRQEEREKAPQEEEPVEEEEKDEYNEMAKMMGLPTTFGGSKKT
uniref:U1-type domain-containing protein n=1 Tax=Arcella intermedia TaxID=1963864 RepID=A0A6B2LH59_9EUKA